MKTHTERAPLAARAAHAARDPYQLERVLGIVLWLAFFAVLFSLGE
ncbi:MAG: hypothetical protein O2816_17070 [Planctomycetota bacterium]|nr:hypothetical protein [Planctomycetota bacterium]